MDPDQDDGVGIDIPPSGEWDGSLGWWEVIGGAWRWVTDPTPAR